MAFWYSPLPPFPPNKTRSTTWWINVFLLVKSICSVWIICYLLDLTLVSVEQCTGREVPIYTEDEERMERGRVSWGSDGLPCSFIIWRAICPYVAGRHRREGVIKSCAYPTTRLIRGWQQWHSVDEAWRGGFSWKLDWIPILSWTYLKYNSVPVTN